MKDHKEEMERLELVERFIIGQLNERECEEMEQRIAENEEFAAFVETQRLVMYAIDFSGFGSQDAEQSEFRKALGETEKNLDNRNFFQTRNQNLRELIAAEEIDLIQKYLNHQLNKSEQEKIEQRIEKDEAFAQEVEMHRLLGDAISARMIEEEQPNIKFSAKTTFGQVDETERKNLEKRLKNTEKRLSDRAFFEGRKKADQASKESPKKEGLLVRFRYFMAAAACVLAILTIWFLIPKGNSTEPIFASSTLPTEDVLSVEIEDKLTRIGLGGNSKEALTELQKGIDLYKEQKYAEALPIFEENLTNPNYRAVISPLKVEFYQAHSLYSLAKYEKALPLFEKLATNDGFALQLQSKWFLALSYLKTDNPAKAQPLLKELRKNKTYEKEAQDLLESVG